MRFKSILLAIAAGLVLADASIVTLALPELLTDLHTTIEGVAAVIGAGGGWDGVGHDPFGSGEDVPPEQEQLEFAKRVKAEKHIQPPTDCSGCHR